MPAARARVQPYLVGGDAPLSAGTQLTEDLRLVRELGAGGMGSVWQAMSAA